MSARTTFAVGRLTSIEIRITRPSAPGAPTVSPHPKLSPELHEVVVLPVPGWCCRAFCSCGWASETLDREEADFAGKAHRHRVRRHAQ